MSPLNFIPAAINAIRIECFELADQAGVFLKVDESGNIWLEDGHDEECVLMYGWTLTHRKLKKIISQKEYLNE